LLQVRILAIRAERKDRRPSLGGRAPLGGAPRIAPKIKNEPEKLFGINKNVQKRTRNEPERTRGDAIINDSSCLESARLLGSRKNERETNLKRTRAAKPPCCVRQTEPGRITSARSEQTRHMRPSGIWNLPSEISWGSRRRKVEDFVGSFPKFRLLAKRTNPECATSQKGCQNMSAAG
jgi:hypothetical protein